MSCKKYDHITPVLINLHWLLVRYRINFKILSLTFKALYGMEPSYIIDLIHCCGATEGSEQQHNQDLKEIYKGRRILEFITFYHNALHLTTLLTTMHCI